MKPITVILHKATSPLIPNTHNTAKNIWVTFTFHSPLVPNWQISKLHSDPWIAFITYYIYGLTTPLHNTKLAFTRWNAKHVNFHIKGNLDQLSQHNNMSISKQIHLNWFLVYNYVMHVPRNTPHTPLLTFDQHYRPISNIPPCSTYLHREQGYLTKLPSILLYYWKILLFMYIQKNSYL
jgi:hypothetical protein